MARNRTVYKEVIDFHINEKTKSETSQPVDYSFSALTELIPMLVPRARGDRVGIQPDISPNTMRYLTKAIWLNNNKLTTTKYIEVTLNSTIDRPADMKWIDFSYNRITEIHPSLTSYKDLTILYFHGNKINCFEQVAVLRPLKHLRSVTFHGNPIANVLEYRKHIIALLPQIKNLDFSAILKLERMQPLKSEALKMLQQILSKPNKINDENGIEQPTEGALAIETNCKC